MILLEFADFLPLSLLVVYASIIFEAAKVKISENVLKPEVHMKKRCVPLCPSI